MIADALYPYPDDLVIATKGGLTHPAPDVWVRSARPERLKRCCEDSLRRLRLERIDIYQLHWIDPEVPIEDSAAALAELQQEGKIRHVGLCNVTVEGLERAQTLVDVVSIQNHYNVFRRHTEDVLECCQRQGLAYLPYYPLATGALVMPGGSLDEIAATHGATSAQVALAWLLQHSPVVAPIPGTSSVAHFEDNVQAAALELSGAEMEVLDDFAPRATEATGLGQPFPGG
jgi:aryl-alcohol dehydrogenase-like predicted oxidoreductase